MKKEIYILIIMLVFFLLIHTACTKENINPEPTPIHTPICGYAFGNNADNDTLGWAGGYYFASPFTIPNTEEISSIVVKLADATNYAAGIYSDNAGVPADVITQTGVVSGIAGWNTKTAATASLNAGVTYWLLVVTENVGARISPGTGTGKYALVSWSDVSTGLPLDLNSEVWNNFTDEIKIYTVSCK
jgi:hypothetical protein